MNSRDGIIGLAIGDAMGVPVEFVERENAGKRYCHHSCDNQTD